MKKRCEFIGIVISLILTGCSNHDQFNSPIQSMEAEEKITSLEKETSLHQFEFSIDDEALFLLERLIVTLDEGINLAYQNANLVLEVWKSSLNKEIISSQTSAFTQPHGKFVEPKEAIQWLEEDPTFQEKNQKIKELLNTANTLVEEIESQNISTQYVELYQEAMKAYELGTYFMNYPFNLTDKTYPRDLESYEKTEPAFLGQMEMSFSALKNFYMDEILYF